jgi:hypothetical protein
VNDREKFGRELARFVATRAADMNLSPDIVLDGFAVVVSSLLEAVGSTPKEQESTLSCFCEAVGHYNKAVRKGTVQ